MRSSEGFLDGSLLSLRTLQSLGIRSAGQTQQANSVTEAKLVKIALY